MDESSARCDDDDDDCLPLKTYAVYLISTNETAKGNGIFAWVARDRWSTFSIWSLLR